MSMDMRLIDLTDEKMYDVAGGKNLYWLLPLLAGHKICIDGDDNGGLDFYADTAKTLGFEEIDAWEMPIAKPNSLDNRENNYHLLNKEFHSIRFVAEKISRQLNEIYDYDLDMWDDETRKDLTTAIKENLPYFEVGYAKDLEIPYYIINSISDLFKIGLLFINDDNEDYDLYKDVSQMNYELVVC